MLFRARITLPIADHFDIVAVHGLDDVLMTCFAHGAYRIAGTFHTSRT